MSFSHIVLAVSLDNFVYFYFYGFSYHSIDDQGEVLSIKFSEDNKILGIQRTHRSVDFLNFQANCPRGVQYSQECKVTLFLIVTSHVFVCRINQQHFWDLCGVPTMRSFLSQTNNWSYIK